MDKNISMDVTEENSANASDMAKVVKACDLNKIGKPLSVPPGTVKMAANITVVISVETSMQDEAVLFIQSSPSLTRALCSSVNNILGVRPFLSLICFDKGCTVLSTSWN